MKRIIIVGSVALLTIFLVVAYSLFSLLGITQTRIKRVDLTISTESDFKIYDGSPLQNSVWVIKSGKLNKNDSIEVTMTSSITEVGSIKNDVGVTIFNDKDLDVTNNYNIKYDLGNLVVSGIPLTIYTGSSTKMYDGKPLSNQDWSIVAGALRENDKIETQMPVSVTLPEVATNKVFVTIYDSSNKDVTKNYNIKYELGKVSVLKIPIVLKSNSENKVYDGKVLINDDYEVLNGEVLEGHTLVVDVTGEIQDVGRTENQMYAYVVNEFGINVSHYYEFTYFTGILEVQGSIYSSETISKEAPIEDNTPVLKILATESGLIYLRDRSLGEYNLQGFEKGISYSSSFYFNPLSLTNRALLNSGFTSKILEIEYIRAQLPYLLPYYVSDLLEGQNDIEYKRPTATFQYNEYVSFDYINSTINISQDESLITFEEIYRNFVYEEYLKLPESTRRVMLEIASDNGLNPNSESIIQDVKNYIENAANYNLNFASIPEDVSDIAAYFLLVSKEGLCQHFATAATVMYRALGIPARYTTGYLAEAKKDEWVTLTGMNAHAWVEVYIDQIGWVVVETTATLNGNGGGSGEVPGEEPGEDPGEEPGEQGGGSGNNDSIDYKLTATPVTVKAPYEIGLTIEPVGVRINEFKKYADLGYSFSAKTSGSLSTPGVGVSRITELIIYDKDLVDVTSEFDITLRNGKLQLYLHEITVETARDCKIYDGTVLQKHEYLLSDTLESGHRVMYVDFKGFQLYAGSSKNTAIITIVDEFGLDVTELYNVNYEYGDLVIEPRLITIKSESKSKTFDGTELTASGYEITFGTLAEGDVVTIINSGSQTTIGKADNTVDSIRIYNGVNDVTKNYQITIIEGILTVLPNFNE